MAGLNDWQWASGAAVLIASLALGGWLSRERIDGSENSEPHVVHEPASPNTAPSTYDTSELNQLRQQLEARDSELNQLRQQLEARDSELKDAVEEAELALLQLHQVQEELEHYFLESRGLQQKLDAVQTITPEQQDKLKRINARLLQLFKTLPASANRNAQSPSGNRIEALVQRQQNALRRFQALQKQAEISAKR